MSGETSDLRAWLDTRRQHVEQALDRFIPIAGSPSSGSFIPATARAPSVVAEATRYSLFAGGKRLRPMLALAAAEAVAEHLGESAEAA